MKYISCPLRNARSLSKERLDESGEENNHFALEVTSRIRQVLQSKKEYLMGVVPILSGNHPCYVDRTK